jgi:hypothetical protein
VDQLIDWLGLVTVEKGVKGSNFVLHAICQSCAFVLLQIILKARSTKDLRIKDLNKKRSITRQIAVTDLFVLLKNNCFSSY